MKQSNPGRLIKFGHNGARKFVRGGLRGRRRLGACPTIVRYVKRHAP
jgi:hypothetical protein